MRYYYTKNNIDCSIALSQKLYFGGMLYNTIIPGGITGEAYKIFMMQKLKSAPKLLSLKIMLSNRASGLYILILIATLLSCKVIHLPNFPIKTWHLLSILIITSIGYLMSLKLILKEPFKIAVSAGYYSFFIQILSLLSAYFLLNNIIDSAFENMISYLLLFMISSIIQILPITLAGAGIREITFLTCAKYLPINIEIGIAFSMTYFLLNMVVSLIGLLFINNLKLNNYCN
jgi:hypothetical protein